MKLSVYLSSIVTVHCHLLLLLLLLLLLGLLLSLLFFDAHNRSGICRRGEERPGRHRLVVLCSHRSRINAARCLWKTAARNLYFKLNVKIKIHRNLVWKMLKTNQAIPGKNGNLDEVYFLCHAVGEQLSNHACLEEGCEERCVNVNVNVRHTYWAPLNPVTEALHAVELTFFLWHMPEGVAEHSFLGCNHQSTCMPSYSLYVQLAWYPMYYPGGMKARVCPVQWSEPHSILAPTQDSNPGSQIQNHKRWPLHYHCTCEGNDDQLIIREGEDVDVIIHGCDHPYKLLNYNPKSPKCANIPATYITFLFYVNY